MVGSIISLLGSAFDSFFIILGAAQPIIELKTLYPYTGRYGWPIMEPVTQTILVTPNYFSFSIGVLVLFLTLIVLGVTIIAMREAKMSPSSISAS